MSTATIKRKSKCRTKSDPDRTTPFNEPSMSMPTLGPNYLKEHLTDRIKHHSNAMINLNRSMKSIQSTISQTLLVQTKCEKDVGFLQNFLSIIPTVLDDFYPKLPVWTPLISYLENIVNGMVLDINVCYEDEDDRRNKGNEVRLIQELLRIFDYPIECQKTWDDFRDYLVKKIDTLMKQIDDLANEITELRQSQKDEWDRYQEHNRMIIMLNGEFRKLKMTQ